MPPAPEYPLGARVHYWTANGISVCKFSPDGTVSAVNVKQSTGHEIIDQAAIAALLRFLVMAVIEIVPNIRKEKG